MKVATYNIHSCIDTRGVLDMEKTTEVIAAMDADIVALQEVDAQKARTGYIHQAEWLAERLGMTHAFFPVVVRGDERYGLAILTRIPMESVKFARLPSVTTSRKTREMRGAMWVRLRTHDMPVSLMNTHLGLLGRERRLQIQTLLGDDWLGGLPETEPVIICGDFNAGRRSYAYRLMTKRYFDVQRSINGGRSPRATFLSYYPIRCLDHIFVSRHFSPRHVRVFSAAPARTASDHLPVLAELAFKSSSVPNPR